VLISYFNKLAEEGGRTMREVVMDGANATPPKRGAAASPPRVSLAHLT
jgi:hypothetical protein